MLYHFPRVAIMIVPKPHFLPSILASTALLLSAFPVAALIDWKPQSVTDAENGYSVVEFTDASLSVSYVGEGDHGSITGPIQQMRNMRDLMRVDQYRRAYHEPAPTPTPTPTPPPKPSSDDSDSDEAEYVTSVTFSTMAFGDSGPTAEDYPQEPFRQYFSEMAAIYKDSGYPGIAKELERTGRVMEGLVHPRGKKRHLAARRLAMRLEAAVRAADDSHLLLDKLPTSFTLRAYDTPPESGHDYYRRDDYRAIAWQLAANLRRASQNVRRGQPLTRRQPILNHTLTLAISCDTTVTSGYYGYNVTKQYYITRSDGRGGAASAIVPIIDNQLTSAGIAYAGHGAGAALVRTGSATSTYTGATTISGGSLTLPGGSVSSGSISIGSGSVGLIDIGYGSIVTYGGTSSTAGGSLVVGNLPAGFTAGTFRLGADGSTLIFTRPDGTTGTATLGTSGTIGTPTPTPTPSS